MLFYTDIDECKNGHSCDENLTTCDNLPGGYQCECSDGQKYCQGEDYKMIVVIYLVYKITAFRVSLNIYGQSYFSSRWNSQQRSVEYSTCILGSIAYSYVTY